MELWRISIFADLEGLGGKRAAARWHTAAPEKRIVYLAEHPALSLLEVLVNLQGDETELAAEYRLIKVAAADDVSIRRISEASLSRGWREKPEETQFLGNEWLSEGQTALLAVPAASVPESTNYLLNPLHPDANQVSVDWVRRIEFDKRLLRFTPPESDTRR